MSVEHVHYFDLNQIQTKEFGHSWTFTVSVCTTVPSGTQEWAATIPLEMKENPCQPHLSIKKDRKRPVATAAD